MMVVRVCVDIAHGMYLVVLRPSVKNAPFHGRERMIMMVRASDAPCESPHGMFLV